MSVEDHLGNRGVVLRCDPAGNRVRPEFREGADVNAILRKYSQGVLPQVTAVPLYGDFSNVGDFQGALAAVAAAREAFASLPSAVRKACGNDPARFVAWASDPRNAKELAKLGLAEARPGAAASSAAPAEGSGQAAASAGAPPA